MSNESLFKTLTSYECQDSTYRPRKNKIVLDRAQGSIVYDVEGHGFIDLCAGFGALPFGHNPTYLKKIFSVTSNEPAKIMHGLGDVYPTVDKIQFLEKFFSVLPKHLNKAAVALSGAQAVELALKTAMIATGRHSFLAFNNGYHGLDLSVLPVTYRQDFRAPFLNYLRQEGTSFLPYGCDVAMVADELGRKRTLGDPVAAVIVEPVQGRGGVVLPPENWLADLRKVCTQYEALLIFDEVFTGFGRCGKYTFATDVAADLVCFGKALGGGFPLSVCVGTKDVMDAWPRCESEALHTGTFFGHPLSCRVGLETIEEFKVTSIISTVNDKGNRFRKNLQKIFSDLPIVKNIRGCGLMTGIEFDRAGFGARMMDDLRADGVIAIPSGSTGEVLSITPALNISESVLTVAIEKLKKAVITAQSTSSSRQYD